MRERDYLVSYKLNLVENVSNKWKYFQNLPKSTKCCDLLWTEWWDKISTWTPISENDFSSILSMFPIENAEDIALKLWSIDK